MDTPDERPTTHCQDDDLALRALGEPSLDAQAEAHLAGCGACQNRLDELRGIVRTGRATSAEDRLVAPPPTLWEGVAHAIRADRDAAEPTVVRTQVGARRRIEPRRRIRAVTLGSIAAAAAIVVALALVVVSPLGDDTDDRVTTTDIALAPIAPSTAQGVAVMASSDGTASMTVDVPGLPAADGFYEVWLMDGGSQLVSLGALDAAHRGTFQVPAGLDVSRYRYVDVSLEPFDGNPGHSTDSVVRGTLPA